jgi:general secretion pathway protein F/type IV pilus assembly protein PilC
MSLFRYDAIDQKGKKISGALDAESLTEAKLKLIKQSIFLTQISPLSPKLGKAILNRQEVLNFTRELSRLLKAGLPLFESLSAMEEKYRGQKGQPLLLDLCQQVKAGFPFSAALARHGKTFDLLYTAMVSNAEKTGRMSGALDELSSLLAKQLQVRKQLIDALLYPSLLFGFCLFVLSSLLFYVVPSLQELFEGRNLHPFTSLVFAMSQFACHSKLFLLTLFASLIAGVVAIGFSSRWKALLFNRVAKMPGIGPLLAKVALIRFCRAAATLLEGSVPIVSAFAQARATMGHPALEMVVEKAEQMIGEGAPIHAAFLHSSLIPPLVPRMVAIAEEAGNLPSMLQQIGEIYEEDLERTLSHFATVAQPALLLLLGAIVGFVLLSVLLPLTDVSSFAQT